MMRIMRCAFPVGPLSRQTSLKASKVCVMYSNPYRECKVKVAALDLTFLNGEIMPNPQEYTVASAQKSTNSV